MTHHPFPPTRWSLVARVSDRDPGEQARALEELCRTYWPPVYAFLRSRGEPHAEAEDLTQGVFASILERDNLARVSPERGKFRTFLLTAAKNFAANDRRHRQRLKRGGGVDVLSIDLTHQDSHERIIEPEEGDTPESIFERQWALTVLYQVFDELEERYSAKGQEKLFAALRFVVSPGETKRSYAEIATELGMSEGAVKVAAHRLRERYGRLLRDTIRDTLEEGGDVDEELRELINVFH